MDNEESSDAWEGSFGGIFLKQTMGTSLKIEQNYLLYIHRTFIANPLYRFCAHCAAWKKGGELAEQPFYDKQPGKFNGGITETNLEEGPGGRMYKTLFASMDIISVPLLPVLYYPGKNRGDCLSSSSIR